MKKSLFFENAKLLSDKFGIIPLMYGSLGLEYITGVNLNSNDIDILIPEVFLKERWHEFKRVLTENEYVLIDEHEHTFQKNAICYSYASAEELETFAKISLSHVERKNIGNIRFGVLNLKQYLEVYNASSKDGYRINVRQKKDFEKITFIKNFLKGQLEG